MSKRSEVECIRLMDDGRGKILSSTRFEKVNLAALNEILSNNSFTMNAADEASLIEQLKLREDKIYNDYENCTHTKIIQNVEAIEYYGLDLEGNEVDIILFYINGNKIFETS